MGKRMANPWFRMYSEFASDPKVQGMSEQMQRRLLMLMCLKCNDTLATLTDDDISFHMRISGDELEQTRTLFVKKGFITKTWELRNWSKRQFVSDSSAARQKSYRDRQKSKASLSVVKAA